MPFGVVPRRPGPAPLGESGAGVWRALVVLGGHPARVPDLGAPSGLASLGIIGKSFKHERQGWRVNVKKELGTVKQRRANLLDLAVDGTTPKAVFVDRDAPMQAEEERLRRRVEALTADATSSAAAASQQRGVVAHARLLRRGLDKLEPAAWRAFLVKLVDKIVVQPTGLEVHLVIPTAQAESQRSNQSSSSASTLVRAEIGSFSSSW